MYIYARESVDFSHSLRSLVLLHIFCGSHLTLNSSLTECVFGKFHHSRCCDASIRHNKLNLWSDPLQDHINDLFFGRVVLLRIQHQTPEGFNTQGVRFPCDLLGICGSKDGKNRHLFVENTISRNKGWSVQFLTLFT